MTVHGLESQAVKTVHGASRSREWCCSLQCAEQQVGVQPRPLACEFDPQAIELMVPGSAFLLVSVPLAAKQLRAMGPLDQREAEVERCPIEQSPQGQCYGWMCLFIGQAKHGVHRSFL